MQLHGRKRNRKPTKAERAAHDAGMASLFPDTWGKRADLRPDETDPRHCAHCNLVGCDSTHAGLHWSDVYPEDDY